MVYELNWLIPARVLEMTMAGDVEINEMQEMYQEHMQMVRDEGIAPVHVLIDAHAITNIKMKVKQINSVWDPTATDLFGWTIIVTDNRFMKFLTTIFSKVTGSQFKTVANYEEALAILTKQVPELAQELG